MTDAQKQAQIDEMWIEHIHGGWWRLHAYYHRIYRGRSWPPWALREVREAKAAAEADPRGRAYALVD